MTRVALVRCDRYDLDRVGEALQESLDLIGGLGAFVQSGQRVLIKINLLRPSPPEDAVVTHPAFAVALALLVRRLGAEAVIGDSSGGVKAYGQSARALEESGLAALAKEHDIETILFETAGMERVQVKDARYFHEIFVSRAVLDADIIINAPKLKTHVETLLTGGVKNIFGVLPGAFKLNLHRHAPSPARLGEALLDIYSAVRPALCVMDGILAMHGKGPSWGKPISVNAVLASADSVALDHVAARLVGLDPMRVPTIPPAGERGLGEINEDKIEIVGQSLESMKPAGFKLCGNALMRAIPLPLMNLLNKRLLSARPRWYEPGCKRHGECVKICPVNAMDISEEGVSIDYEACIDCMACYMVCPADGIRIKKSLMAKVLSA